MCWQCNLCRATRERSQDNSVGYATCCTKKKLLPHGQTIIRTNKQWNTQLGIALSLFLERAGTSRSRGICLPLLTYILLVRPDYSVINVGIQYSGVRFECYYCAGFCFIGKYADWEHREIASKISWWPTGELNLDRTHMDIEGSGYNHIF